MANVNEPVLGSGPWGVRTLSGERQGFLFPLDPSSQGPLPSSLHEHPTPPRPTPFHFILFYFMFILFYFIF